MAASNAAASRPKRDGSTSAKTGRAPAWITPLAVAK
jgi:hypothetical protein